MNGTIVVCDIHVSDSLYYEWNAYEYKLWMSYAFAKCKGKKLRLYGLKMKGLYPR